jgi:Ca2+:H+ antiporter
VARRDSMLSDAERRPRSMSRRGTAESVPIVHDPASSGAERDGMATPPTPSAVPQSPRPLYISASSMADLAGSEASSSFQPTPTTPTGFPARALSYVASDAGHSERMEASIHEEEEDTVAPNKGKGKEGEDTGSSGSSTTSNRASAGDESGSDDDDDEDTGDMEYTLKDRQDVCSPTSLLCGHFEWFLRKCAQAYNIEHPFGLPIWKPALYKKSRSITRNAETALHLTPSYAAERHLLPGNILWTLLFGCWLFVVCGIAAAILCLVPWGGAKYARVIWELGTYLFWPFGRYVERFEEGDISANADDTEAEASSRKPTWDGDAENAGRTWGRKQTQTRVPTGTLRPQDLDDELLRGSGGVPNSPQRSPASFQQRRLPVPLAERRVSYAAEPPIERTSLVPPPLPAPKRSAPNYGALTGYQSHEQQQASSSSESTELGENREDSPTKGEFSPFSNHHIRVRALGRLMYWATFYLIVAPCMLVVCLICWAGVFTIPMAKLLWILVRHLGEEPLRLHFRSPPPSYYSQSSVVGDDEANKDMPNGQPPSRPPPLKVGQRAPPRKQQDYAAARGAGRFVGLNSKILLCTYRAVGLQYYKYTIEGVNIMFINLLPLVIFAILDFFFLSPFVERHQIGGFLGFLASQSTIFVLALLSVIPLSYFIGMAVASISAQSSIGMGAVINATFGSIIEIILYCFALTQGKAALVEGSIVGSLLAGVLLMPGVSMIAGAVRRKEQRFNARSAGVTSTMLIMALVGALTPTVFYQIYGTVSTLSCFRQLFLIS